MYILSFCLVWCLGTFLSSLYELVWYAVFTCRDERYTCGIHVAIRTHTLSSTTACVCMVARACISLFVCRYLLFAYNDALHRARRLAASHTLTMKTTPTVTINNNDVMIYLRWLVTHLLNTKTLSAFIAVSCKFLTHNKTL